MKWLVTGLSVAITLILFILAGGNTTPGKSLISWLAPHLSGGLVSVEGLSGRFPDRLHAARLELHDKDGVWAIIDDVELDWSPLRLWAGDIAIRRLAATRIAVERLPKESAGTGSGRRFTTEIDALNIARVDIAEAVTGSAAVSLAIDGSAAISGTNQSRVSVFAKGIEPAGSYRLDASLEPTGLDIRVAGQEPSHGLIAELAALPDIGEISVDGTVSGPRKAAVVHLDVTAGQSRASAEGTIDLENQSTGLSITATAPAMTPRADLSWKGITLKARINGPLVRPVISGTLQVDTLKVADASVAHIEGEVQSDSGNVTLRAALAGIRIPGPKPDLLSAAPVQVTARMDLGQPDRPIEFSLTHPMISADGIATVRDGLHGRIKLDVPNLTPMTALAGLDLQGHATLELAAASQDGKSQFDIDALVGVTGGTGPIPALIGDNAHVTLSVTSMNSAVTASRFEITGRGIKGSGAGGGSAEKMAFNWQLALADLTDAVPTLIGAINMQGQVSGAFEDLTVTADLSGTIGLVGWSESPFSAKAQLTGLPDKPTGNVTIQGQLANSPIELAVAGSRADDGELRVTIERAGWKSAHAQGTLALPSGSRFPRGQLDLRMTRLSDLTPLTGHAISGSMTANVTTIETAGRPRVDLRSVVRDVGFADKVSGGRAELTASIADPMGHPRFDSRLIASASLANGFVTSVRTEVAGPEEALSLKLDGDFGLESDKVRLVAAGTINAVTRVASVSTLQAGWRNEDLRLLGPARIAFGDGVNLNRLRFGLEQGTIDVSGRMMPTLDLAVAMRNMPVNVAAVIAPGLAADGVLQGDATLTGTIAQPKGRIELAANGLQMRTAEGRIFPATNATATVELAGTSAHLNVQAVAGPKATLSVRGQLATTAAEAIDLHVGGAIDLTVLNPLLTAGGRRAAGKVTIDAHVGGDFRTPQISGTARLADGAFEDFALGVHITNVSGLAEATGGKVRLTSLRGVAGPGSIELGGSADILTSQVPIDLTITVRNARLPASDRLTAVSNGDLHLHGEAFGSLTLSGQIDVLHAEIGIPKNLPVDVPVLNVRVIGQPVPKTAPPTAIDLDLTVVAHQVVVRGRGLFAELAGSIRVKGSSTALQPVGSFQMARGNLSIAGQTLTFDKGDVGFNGGSLTDPSLDFVATSSTSTMTGSIAISGTVSNPKVKITSTPDLPQDEVLAQLLFHRSSSTLSPFQLGQIASSLGELTGATSGVGDPLNKVRQSLGLEQLSIGTGSNNSTTLQAGRYVAQGVYVGAQQGTGSNSSQARVEVDITKQLKLVGTVGVGTNTTPGATAAESAGTSLGLKYQLEY